MDSIAYIEDPADSSIMSNIIKEYGMAHQVNLYDKYDRENDRAAFKFLLDSYDTEL
jgi:hypothetical protein